MRMITLEEHVATPEYYRLTGAQPANAYIAAIEKKLADLGEGRLADMDAAGITMQVLSLTAMGMERLEAAATTFLAMDTNDVISQAVNAHPDRFAAFAV